MPYRLLYGSHRRRSASFTFDTPLPLQHTNNTSWTGIKLIFCLFGTKKKKKRKSSLSNFTSIASRTSLFYCPPPPWRCGGRDSTLANNINLSYHTLTVSHSHQLFLSQIIPAPLYHLCLAVFVHRRYKHHFNSSQRPHLNNFVLWSHSPTTDIDLTTSTNKQWPTSFRAVEGTHTRRFFQLIRYKIRAETWTLVKAVSWMQNTPLQSRKIVNTKPKTSRIARSLLNHSTRQRDMYCTM